MSTLQESTVYLNKDEFRSEFVFNNINIYDLFIYSCYSKYNNNVHCGKYELGVINSIILKAIEKVIASVDKDGNKIYRLTSEDSNKIIKDANKIYNQVDQNNITRIMDKLGLSGTINTLQKAMSSSLKVNEQNNQEILENNGIKNKANSEKFKAIQKFSIRISVFILSLVHDIYWDKYTTNDPAENINNVINGKDIDDCYESVISVSQQLIKLFNHMIDLKYPSNISVSVMEADFKLAKLEYTDVIENVDKTIKKKKKHKK